MPEDFTPQDGENGSSAFDEFLARYLDGERARASRSIDLRRFLSAAHAGVPAAGGALRARARPARARRPARAARPGRRVAGQGRRRARRRRSRRDRPRRRAAAAAGIRPRRRRRRRDHALGAARAVPRLPGRALVGFDLRRPRAPLLRARARSGRPRRAGPRAGRRHRRRSAAGRARDRDARRRDRRPSRSRMPRHPRPRCSTASAPT